MKFSRIVIGLLCTATLQAAPSIKLCHDEQELYPWRTGKGKGLDFKLLELAQSKAGVAFEYDALPWKRCLSDVQRGAADGAIAASFKKERLEIGVYPMQGEEPDASLRMRTESYSLFKLKNAPVTWDGKRIGGLDGPVGAQFGYSIVDQLKALGVEVDSGAAKADDNFKKLMMGRVSAVALLTQEGNYSLRDEAEVRNNVERIALPLAEKPYYLIFSKQYFSANEAQVRKLWAAIATARDSAEFKKIEASFK